MRDERWVDRFLYAWNKTPWFDPIDRYYQPKGPDYLPEEPHLRERFERHGVWTGYGRTDDLPAQGWKIHVSASLADAPEVARRSVKYLISGGLTFKVALDQNVYAVLCSKAAARGSSGKLITIYPRTLEEFRSVLSDLSSLLEGLNGPFILSDMRYKDSSCLYFRYGQFLNTFTLDPFGRQIPHIEGPDGIVADLRSPGAYRPAWVDWPFDDWDEPEPGASLELDNGRFRITEALQFSNSGGVYKAEDTTTGDLVVLKEARPYTNPDITSGMDATACLRREWAFLNRLEGTGKYPRPIAYFTDWEHDFLAESFIEGNDIRQVFFDLNPLVKPHAWDAQDSTAFLRAYLKMFISFIGALEAAHQRNIVIGDISARNVIVDPGTWQVSLVDVEAARLLDQGNAEGLGDTVPLYTPGFVSATRRDRGSEFSDDLYGLAAIMGYVIYPISVMTFLRPHATPRLFASLIDRLGWPASIGHIIDALSTDTITLRAAREELESLLDREGSVVTVEHRTSPIDTPPPSELATLRDDLIEGIVSTADPDRFSLFPVDPFAHHTNGLGLGFGAAGILGTLNHVGHRLDASWTDWLSERCQTLTRQDIPAGLLTGGAGISWALHELGDQGTAEKLLTEANTAAPEVEDYTVYYGISGIGLANLRMAHGTQQGRWLDDAVQLGALLWDRRDTDDHGIRWSNQYTSGQTITGFGLGQAGVALFLRRLADATGDQVWTSRAEQVMRAELDRGFAWGEAWCFDHRGTAEPYIEVGGAGIAQVAARLGIVDHSEQILRSLRFEQSVLPGYIFGLSGVAETLLDLGRLRSRPDLVDTGLRQLLFVRDTFSFRPDEPGVPQSRTGTPSGALIAGEGLMRASADVATGAAGVLRVVHRALSGAPNDWYLDDCTP